eukprot:368448_1
MGISNSSQLGLKDTKIYTTKVATNKPKRCKISIIGDAAVGKSNLVSRFVENSFTWSYIPTRHVDMKRRQCNLNNNNINFLIFEQYNESKLEQYISETNNFAMCCRGVHGLIFMFDLTNINSFVNIREYLHEAETYTRDNTRKMLIGNKSDLMNKRKIQYDEAQSFANKYGMQYVEVSAKYSYNIEAAFFSLAADIYHIHYKPVFLKQDQNETPKIHEWKLGEECTVYSNVYNKWFPAEIIQKISSKRGEEVWIRYKIGTKYKQKRMSVDCEDLRPLDTENNTIMIYDDDADLSDPQQENISDNVTKTGKLTNEQKEDIGSKLIDYNTKKPTKIMVSFDRDNNLSLHSEKIQISATIKGDKTLSDFVNEIMQKINDHEKLYPAHFTFESINLSKSKCIYSFDSKLTHQISSICTNDMSNNTWNINVKLKPFEHKIASPITCKSMLNNSNNNMNPFNCLIYKKMISGEDFSNSNLYHLMEFNHFEDEYTQKPKCKFDGKCISYMRLENGGNDINDLCHVKLYRHPPRRRQIELSENVNHFILNKQEQDNKSLYKPVNKLQHNNKGYLQQIIKEVIANGFKSDLCLDEIDEKKEKDSNEKYSIINIVENKLKCHRHKIMGSPLNKSEMLSLILYTG